MSKKEGGKCISTNVKLIETSNWRGWKSKGFHNLLQMFLDTLKIFIIATCGLGAGKPLNAKGKNMLH